MSKQLVIWTVFAVILVGCQPNPQQPGNDLPSAKIAPLTEKVYETPECIQQPCICPTSQNGLLTAYAPPPTTTLGPTLTAVQKPTEIPCPTTDDPVIPLPENPLPEDYRGKTFYISDIFAHSVIILSQEYYLKNQQGEPPNLYQLVVFNSGSSTVFSLNRPICKTQETHDQYFLNVDLLVIDQLSDTEFVDRHCTTDTQVDPHLLGRVNFVVHPGSEMFILTNITEGWRIDPDSLKIVPLSGQNMTCLAWWEYQWQNSCSNY